MCMLKWLQLCPTLCNPLGCSLPGSSVHGVLQEEYWSGLPCPPPGDLPNPGIKPRIPALQMDSLPSEPPGKLKNSGVGSLSLSLGSFLTQKLNQGLLHCRQILYQLSYKGSPFMHIIIHTVFAYPYNLFFLCWNLFLFCKKNLWKSWSISHWCTWIFLKFTVLRGEYIFTFLVKYS